MKFKSRIMDESAMQRALVRISHEITERNKGAQGLVLVGIKSRGIPLARMISDNILKSEGVGPEVISLDISLYRDDLTEISADAQVKGKPDGEIKGKKIVLVDDVLFTGRTVRAAIDALLAGGRPAAIQLAVLIDRGHRELPIRADYVGKNVPTSLDEVVAVSIPPYDDVTAVDIYSLKD